MLKWELQLFVLILSQKVSCFGCDQKVNGKVYIQFETFTAFFWGQTWELFYSEVEAALVPDTIYR